jgi:excisionase family DNA binding protein
MGTKKGPRLHPGAESCEREDLMKTVHETTDGVDKVSDAASLDRLTLTVDQCAKVLGLSRGKTYELARQGQLPGVVRFGRRVLVVRKALERALAGDAEGETT